MAELKPCPLCGGTAVETEYKHFISIGGYDTINATIQCPCCGLKLTKKWYEANLYSNISFCNNETVYDLWNRRADNG